MDATMSEVVQFIQENDVKFIRLAFCDIFGNQKNIAIMPTELTRAFEQGIHFNASALRGFLNVDDSDLLLFPDAATLSVLPWRPAQGRVVRFYCDIRYPDGRPFEGDGRHLLREASRRARRAGYALTMGTASEFYLFELDENGHPTTIPHDHGEYFDVAPLDKAENVRRQICLTLEEMGIQPESSHHEQGPGQNEVDFRYAEALEAADNFVTFKWVVKSMASSSGLFASFLPKPLQGAPAAGCTCPSPSSRTAKNLFHPSFEQAAEGRSFVAGILRRAAEMTIFGNPLTNSFQRLGEYEAPKYITWSHRNRSPFLTVPLAGDGLAHRMKVRAFDGCITPISCSRCSSTRGWTASSSSFRCPRPAMKTCSPPRTACARSISPCLRLCATRVRCAGKQRICRPLSAQKGARCFLCCQADRARPDRAGGRPPCGRTRPLFRTVLTAFLLQDKTHDRLKGGVDVWNAF